MNGTTCNDWLTHEGRECGRTASERIDLRPTMAGMGRRMVLYKCRGHARRYHHDEYAGYRVTITGLNGGTNDLHSGG